MPPLKNLKREQFTDEYIKPGSNGQEAYIAVYGECSENSARTKSSRLLTIANVRERIIEKLQEDVRTSPDGVQRKLSSLTEATRPVIVKDRVELYPDNGVQLETAKTLTKIYGVLGVTGDGGYQDNRSINITVSSQDITSLSTIINRLSDIELRQDKVSGLIQEGMIKSECGVAPPLDEV